MSDRGSFRPRVLGLVALGGAAGTIVRAAVENALVVPRGAFPWATWWVNVAGSLVVGVVVAISLERSDARWIRPLLATGFCGGLTTFSSLVVELDRLVQSGRPATAVVYAAASLAAGFAAAYVGVSGVRAVGQGRRHKEGT